MTDELRVYTSRYANHGITDSGLTPMGITLGNPRFKLTYHLAISDRRFAPTRDMFGLSHEEFTQRFRAKLDRLGPAALDILEMYDRSHGSRGLVLLCFEDLRKAGEFCHRRVLADWLYDCFNLHVPELEESGKPSSAVRPSRVSPPAGSHPPRPIVAPDDFRPIQLAQLDLF